MNLLPYKQTCKHCHTEFRSKGPNKSFCTVECKLDWNSKNIYQYINCDICHQPMRFYPYYASKPIMICSNICKGKWMSDNSQELGLSQRADNMRKNLPDKFWEKGLETRISNGNVINWDISEWKQYWRRCNDLTRKIRPLMLENWDGIDYIDGEYIKDNLNLHFSHGDYPTLDHVIPRSYGFKNKISPYEITQPENLKWTKRRNNSKKNKN